jgi:hypothetical protein
MSRTRMAVAAAAVLLFVVAGGMVIQLNRHNGGHNVTLNVMVTGAKSMNPSNLTANLNDTITINITSDTDGKVHLHVYDIAFDTKAGQTVSHTFKADKTCGCDIEWESTSTHLGQLSVSP